MDSDRSYFMRRAAQERSAASSASDSKVRAVHQALADRYFELAGGAASASQQAERA